MLAYLLLLLNQLIALKDLDHLNETGLLDVLRDIVLHLAVCVSLLAHGVSKEKRHIVLHGLDQRERVLELLLCLVTEPTDEVARQSDSRDLLAHVRNQVKVGLSSVVSTHSL